ncbi:hairy and enhancer of split-related protein helt-like [Pomacea canaliculata]|uniref:hairy and enhancer of split-related protein helt-like n=1 Tax=Pomacea canaliculata TaxID=400727 RepID=UPI000D72CBCD|nr:hairy and enhancer of split-related protein helt-like [Pomacea canaliculata]
MSSRKRERVEQTSHKVIEKRRRDRINNCLSELSQTVPAAFSKQTSGKLEKAEILEMTVEYLRAVQATEIGIRFENGEWFSADIWSDFAHHYQSGYGECLREVVKYMADVEGVSMSDARCIRLVSFLQNRFTPETQSACAAASSCAGSVGSATGSGICVAAGSGSVVVNHGKRQCPRWERGAVFRRRGVPG